jgi:hypothetical protein
VEVFIYFNTLVIAEFYFEILEKNGKMAIENVQKEILKKPEVRSQNKEGNLVSSF